MRRTLATNIRVILVLILALGVLGTLIYYSIRSMERFTSLVDRLNEQQNWQAELAEDIVIDISELDRLARTYQLTLSSSDLEPYLEKIEELRVEIDSLYEGSFGTDYHAQVDTLRQVFTEKVRNFEALIQFKISQSELQDDISALELLASSRSEIISDSMLVPRREVTTTTITSEKQDSLEKKGFLSRLFKGKENEQSSREMMQERTVAYDSAYFEKVDTMMATVESVLRQAESQRRYEQRLLANRELQIASNDLLIIEKLKSIAGEIRRINQKLVRQERTAALLQAEQALNRVIFWVICGGLLTIVFTIWVIRDIFQSGRLQQDLEVARFRAEKLAASREEFLANMSHELRTPLNSIVGFTGQLAASLPGEEERLGHLRSSSEHVLRIVNDLLDYSRIESGKLPIEKIGFKPAMVIDECVAMLRYQAEEKGIDLRDKVDPSLNGLMVEGDPLRLKQILINLAGNAIKFTDNGFVCLIAELTAESRDTYRLRFAVEDTGKGIDKARLAEIFKSFGQEDDSINRRYGGTGLGLTISRKLIEMQGGELRVESEPGEGSVFEFTLNYPGSEKDVYSGNFHPQSVDLDLKGKRLLLVDDDEMNHLLLKPSFEKWRLQFESAFTGEQARTMFTQNQFDFILLDLKLPDVPGEELLYELKKGDNPNSAAKLIISTANPLVQKQEPEIVSLADALLIKPFREYEIAALLSGKDRRETDPDTGTGQPYYTLKNFSKFAGEDPHIMRKFIESFISSNEQNIHQLEKYFEEDDQYALADVAHKMKNTYGQLEVADIMKRLIMLENPLEKISNRRKKETITEIKELSNQLFESLREDLIQIK